MHWVLPSKVLDIVNIHKRHDAKLKDEASAIWRKSLTLINSKKYRMKKEIFSEITKKIKCNSIISWISQTIYS